MKRLVAIHVIVFSLVGLSQAGEEVGPARTEDESKAELVIETGGFTSSVSGLAFSPDGRMIAAAGMDKLVRIWNVETGALVRTLRGHRGVGVGDCRDLAWSPDGRHLVVVVNDYSSESSIRIYDAADGRLLQGLAGQPGQVIHAAFSSDGAYLATAGSLDSEECRVIVWDWASRRPIRELTVLSTWLDYLGFPEGRGPFLMAYDADKQFGWCADDRPAAIREFAAQAGRTPKYAAAAQRIGGVKAADEVATAMANDFLGTARSFRSPELSHDSQIEKVTFRLERQLYLLAGRDKKDGRDRYWAGAWPAGAKPVFFHQHRFVISSIVASPDCSRVASADVHGDVHLWESATGRPIRTFRSLGRPMYAVAFSATGLRLAYGTDAYPTGVWNYNHYAPHTRTFDLETRRITEGAPGDLLTETTVQGELGLRLETIKDGVQLGVYRGKMHVASTPASRVLSYSFVRTPKLGTGGGVLVGEEDGYINYLDREKMGQHVLREFVGHHGVIYSLGESGDGRWLASASEDRTIRIWSLERWQPLADLPFEAFGTGGKVAEVEPEAARAGIREGDRLLSIGGLDVESWYLAIIERRLITQAGQAVELVLDRQGQQFRCKVTLVPGSDFVEPLLSLFIASDDEWVIWTPQGYFDASLGGDSLIGWHVDQGRDKEARFYPAAQFRKQFYRPDVIDLVLKTGDVPRAVELANAARPRPPAALADLRQPRTIRNLEPPAVRILEPAENSRSRETTSTVRAEVRSQNELPIEEVTVLLDGRPLPKDAVRLGEGPEGSTTVAATVTLNPGANRIGVLARNSASSSEPKTVVVNYRGETRSAAPKPKLYLLGIGIAKYEQADLNLQFPRKDAEAFAAAWKGQEGAVFDKVETRLVTDQDASMRNILAGMDWLVKSATQGDVAILFLSAHGLRDSRLNFYLATHEVDPENLRSTGVPFTEVTHLIQDMPCKFLLFADTCHSGGITGAKRARVDDPLRDLVSSEVGAIVFSSSLPNETSLEHARWGHGAFTRGFLDILADPASDLDKDGFLAVTELEYQLPRHVKELTRGQQHAVTQKPPTLPDFNIARVRAATPAPAPAGR